MTPKQAWVSQRVVLQIDVLGDSGYAQISRFGDIDLAGAYLIHTDSQGTWLQETIDSVAYSGQRYELSVYPQVSGAVEVPAMPIEVSMKGWGPDAADSVRQVSASAATITSQRPPGAEDVRNLISTPQLTAEQEWEPAIDSARVWCNDGAPDGSAGTSQRRGIFDRRSSRCNQGKPV